MTVSYEQAIELIAEDRLRLAQRVIRKYEGGIEILNGRYGPYVTDGTRNARVPKDQQADQLGLEECQKLLEQAPLRRAARYGRKKPKLEKDSREGSSQPTEKKISQTKRKPVRPASSS